MEKMEKIATETENRKKKIDFQRQRKRQDMNRCLGWDPFERAVYSPRDHNDHDNNNVGHDDNEEF